MIEILILFVALVVFGGMLLVVGTAGVLFYRQRTEANYGKPQRWIHRDVDTYVSKARRKRELRECLEDLNEGIDGPAVDADE